MKILPMLMLLAGLAFAQSDCLEICCYSEGGTWDADFGLCNDPYATYASCLTECAEAEQATPYQDSGYPDSGYGYSCCGPVFILAGLAGAAYLKN